MPEHNASTGPTVKDVNTSDVPGDHSPPLVFIIKSPDAPQTEPSGCEEEKLKIMGTKM